MTHASTKYGYSKNKKLARTANEIETWKYATID